MAAMTNSIQFVRMNTGEDLVTEVTEVNNDDNIYYIFSNPLKIVYVMGNKPGIMSISLMQWVFPSLCRDQDFTVYPQDIILMNHTSDSMEELGQQRFQFLLCTLSEISKYVNLIEFKLNTQTWSLNLQP
jgi:hypothetical protein